MQGFGDGLVAGGVGLEAGSSGVEEAGQEWGQVCGCGVSGGGIIRIERSGVAQNELLSGDAAGGEDGGFMLRALVP